MRTSEHVLSTQGLLSAQTVTDVAAPDPSVPQQAPEPAQDIREIIGTRVKQMGIALHNYHAAARAADLWHANLDFKGGDRSLCSASRLKTTL